MVAGASFPWAYDNCNALRFFRKKVGALRARKGSPSARLPLSEMRFTIIVVSVRFRSVKLEQTCSIRYLFMLTTVALVL